MTKIFLFDIDNTLLNSGGAGGRAMNLAFRDLFGVEDGFEGVEFSGRTDSSIFHDGLLLHRVKAPAGQELEVGAAVEPVFLAKAARKGSILDIQHFRPARTARR